MTKLKKQEKRERNKKLKEWSLQVRERAHCRCEWCGRTSKEVKLNAHHIITKKYEPLRFSLDNGLCCCPKCHRFSILSAHNNPIRVFLWLKKNRPTALNNLIKMLPNMEESK